MLCVCLCGRRRCAAAAVEGGWGGGVFGRPRGSGWNIRDENEPSMHSLIFHPFPCRLVNNESLELRRKSNLFFLPVFVSGEVKPRWRKDGARFLCGFDAGAEKNYPTHKSTVLKHLYSWSTDSVFSPRVTKSLINQQMYSQFIFAVLSLVDFCNYNVNNYMILCWFCYRNVWNAVVFPFWLALLIIFSSFLTLNVSFYALSLSACYECCYLTQIWGWKCLFYCKPDHIVDYL